MSTMQRWMDKLLGTTPQTIERSGKRVKHGARSKRSAAELAAGVGLATSIEQLEQRQLMFVLQVSPVDPTFQPDLANPGFGTVTTTFGYFIPFLSAEIPAFEQQTGIVEDFEARLPNANLPANVGDPSNFGRFAASSAAVTTIVRANFAPATGNRLDITIPTNGWVELVFRTTGAANSVPRTFVGFEWTSQGVLPGGLNVEARGFAGAGQPSTVLVAGENLAITNRPADPNAPGGAQIRSVRYDQGFQVIRITNTGAQVTLALDNVTGINPPARFSAYLDARLFGAQVQLYGRAETAPGANNGTAIEVLDLYGRDMLATIDMGIPEGDTRLIADANGDGVPDFNDGIGRVNLLRGDARAAFNIIGGTVQVPQVGQPNENVGGIGQFFTFLRARDSLTADFRAGGFALEGSFVNGAWQLRGFEDTESTVIIGSPWIRDNRNTAVYFGGADGTDNTIGRPIRADDPTVTTTVRVFGAVNRPAANPAGAWVRYPYANAGGHFGLTGTLLENQLIAVPLPAFPNAIPNPPAPQPATVSNPVTEQGVGFDAGALLANRVWGQFNIDGLVFGAVRFNGSLSRIVISNPGANIIVDGDLGQLIVNGNLGGTRLITSTAPSDAFRTFPSQVTVGRSLGQVLVSGRIIGTPITVLGATNDPNRATTDFLRYSEIERVIFIDPAATDAPGILAAAARAVQGGGPVFFGGNASDGGIYRNDLLPGAEFIGTGLRGAIISGTLGLGNTQFHSEDSSDVFAFAANVGSTVNVSVQWVPGQPAQSTQTLYARVVDINGRLLATHQFAFLAPDFALPSNVFDVQFNFQAPASDVYYLVMSTNPDGQNDTFVTYTATIQGQAAVTVGMISSGGGNNVAAPILVQSGSVGMIRMGNGFIDPDAGVIRLGGALATVESVQDYVAIGNASISINGSLYSFIAGGDVRGGTISIGGNLGTFQTGRFFTADSEGTSNVGTAFGNIHGTTLTVAGSIGLLDISGSVGFQNTTTGEVTTNRPGTFTLNTGTTFGASPRPGNIGELRIGRLINGLGFTMNTSPNSIIDRFVVGARAFDADSGRIVLGLPTFNFGSGSDIRFLDFQGIALGGIGATLDEQFQLNVGFNQTAQIQDDSGAQYSINISGGAGPLRTSSFATVFFIPLGVGSVVGRVLAQLNGAPTLTITNNSGLGRVALDNILITSLAPGLTRPSVNITGIGEIDIRQLQSIIPLDFIRNSTPNGDLVSVDVAGLNTLLINTGSLGFTESNSFGDRRFGNFVDIASGLQQAVGAPLGINTAQGLLNGNIQQGGQGGTTFAPIQYAANGGVFEDAGTPFDSYLQGLVVRNGNLLSVQAGNRLGDVILQSSGVISSVVANPLNRTGDGVFRGIEGTIYAGSILSVDIGDGIAAPGDTPFAQAGIFAENDIGTVIGGFRVRNPQVRGVIIAGNSAGTGNGGPALNGIGSININGGRIDGAYIGVANLDAFWRSARTSPVGGVTPGDAPAPRGTVHNIAISNTDLLRSRLFAGSFNNITISNGNWDASTLQAAGGAGGIDPQTGLTPGSVGTILASAFVNSTLDGEAGEWRPNSIVTTGDLRTLYATGVNSDIADLNIQVGRNLSSVLFARSLLRSTLAVSGSVSVLSFSQDVRSSQISTGALTVLAVGRNIQASTINANGAISQIYAGGDMSNVAISSTGNGGGIVYLLARSFSGSLTSSGNIGTVYIIGGDFTGTINTSTGGTNTANVSFLYASRDLNVSLNVAGDVGVLFAGRNIGRRLIDGQTGTASTPDVIDVRGNLGSVTAGGQLYADLLVGQSITGLVYAGFASPVFAIPGSVGSDQASDARITAFGRIAGLYWFGDFAGQITSHSGGIGFVYILNGSLRSLGNDASGAPINSIDVRDGDLSVLYLISGHLLGNVSVRDGSLGVLYVTGDAVFGNIGVDPNLSLSSTVGVAPSQFRTQLPPGSANPATVNADGIRNGPTIRAGRDITYIFTTGGIYESAISAGRTIGTVYAVRGVDSNSTPNTPTGTTTPSFIVAGDTVQAVIVTRLANGLFVGAGITDLGADRTIGGIGANAETVRQGAVTSAYFYSGTNNVTISAGMNAGADGLYAQGADDLAAAGISTVGFVFVVGTPTNTRVFTDSSIGFTTAGVVTGGGSFVGSTYVPTATSDPRILTAVPGGHTALVANVATPFTTALGETGTITFSGTGQAFFDDATDSLVLQGTTLGSSLTISNTGASTTISGLRVRSLNDASLGSLRINSANFAGNSGIFVDGTIQSFSANNIDLTSNATFGTGVIGAGAGMGSFSSGTFSRGILQTGGSDGTLAGLRADGDISSVSVLGNFGGGVGVNNRRIQARGLNSLTVNGTIGGVVSIERDISSVVASGALNGAGIRAGGRIGFVSAAGSNSSRVSGGGGISSVNFSSTATDTQILGGGDLGTDGAFGGTGSAADRVSSGSIGSVNIFGDFIRSDVAAGILRGTDGFFGTADDLASDGRATITSVTISGNQVGSASNSQTYRVAATGTPGTLRIANTLVTQSGNFRLTQSNTAPSSIRVSDLRVTQAGGIYQAIVTFSQPISGAASLLQALTIQEVRGTPGTTTLLAPLVGGTPGTPGVDYTVSYDNATLTAVITLSTAITSRNLAADVPGADTLNALSGPGTYRFTIDSTGATRLRGATNDASLDGDANGVPGDNFVRTEVIGDAGDRLTPFTTALGGGGQVSFYSPVNLDLQLSNPGSLNVQSNRTITIRGAIGDHPDFNANGFNVGSDADLYSVTLVAGQTIRLGATQGAAAGVLITPVLGTQQALAIGAITARADGSFYVNVSGTYVILVATTATTFALAPIPQNPPVPLINVGGVANNGAVGGQIGDYSFTFTIENDGNNGFSDQTVPAGSGLVGGNAAVPLPGAFNAARDNTVTVPGQIAGTQYLFRYVRGADATLDNGDDTIIGQLQQISTGDFLGVYATRQAGPNQVLGNGDDVITLRSASGSGADIVVAPLPSAFLGSAATFNQPGNLPFVNVGNYSFRLDAGPNGVFNGNTASDDVVIGIDARGNVIERRAGANGIFSNAVNTDDVTTIRSSIGERDVAGIPSARRADQDVYNLNNGNPIQPGTRYRVTLRANDEGGNFGRLLPQLQEFAGLTSFRVTDLRGQVNFGIFDTTAANTITNGNLIAAPNRVQFFGGATPNTDLANNGITRYGYDARGDFFIEFTAAARIDSATPNIADPADWARLSLYVQGAVRSNYSLDVQQLASATPTPVNTQALTQNILIDTRGGTINWLEPGNRSTTLLAYDPTDNGFTGVYNGFNALDYLLTSNPAVNANSLVLQLQNAFNSITGFNPGGVPLVRVSSNPADFEGQAFSTVFLTSSAQNAASFNNGQFGAVQRVDAFNANTRDQSVVFMPSLNTLGNGSSLSGLDTFIRQLTTTAGRQIGQLLGLRTEVPLGGADANPFSIMPGGNPANIGAGNTYGFNTTSRPLSRTDATTQFFLGDQNAGRLLQRIFAAQ